MRTFSLISLVIITFGCQNNNDKQKQLECKAVAMEAISSSPETMELANSKGLGKDYERAYAAFSDTTLTCDQANERWSAFSNKLDSTTK